MFSFGHNVQALSSQDEEQDTLESMVVEALALVGIGKDASTRKQEEIDSLGQVSPIKFHIARVYPAAENDC